MTIIVTQEEEMIKKTKSHVVFVVTVDKDKKKLFKGNSNNFYKMKRFEKPPQPNGPKKENFKEMCNFCHFFRNQKVNCVKFKAWLDNK